MAVVIVGDIASQKAVDLVTQAFGQDEEDLHHPLPRDPAPRTSR